VSGIRPNPRDGHSCTIANDLMIVFGGDRHHMPFNDLFVLDLAAELQRQSFAMVINRDSQSEMNIHDSTNNAQ